MLERSATAELMVGVGTSTKEERAQDVPGGDVGGRSVEARPSPNDTNAHTPR